jgi:hypothetical protein
MTIQIKHSSALFVNEVLGPIQDTPAAPDETVWSSKLWVNFLQLTPDGEGMRWSVPGDYRHDPNDREFHSLVPARITRRELAGDTVLVWPDTEAVGTTAAEYYASEMKEYVKVTVADLPAVLTLCVGEEFFVVRGEDLVSLLRTFSKAPS